MNRLLFSAAVGAAAMYFLDPQAGRRRRVRTRDRAERIARRVRKAYDVTLRDSEHRVRGLRAEARALGRRLRGEVVDNETLTGRVRAVLGRYVSHPHAIEVTSTNGIVALSGPILAHEVPALMRAVKLVPGVHRVANELAEHAAAGNVSSLQGGVRRRGQRFELLQDNWSPAARLAVGTIGLCLLMRRGLFGRLGGAALLARTLTNLDFATLAGMGPPEQGIEVQKTICVNASVEQVFAFWSDYQNFPRFMSRVREVRVDGQRSHWVVEGPAGVAVEWDAEVVAQEPNAYIQWHSTPDSTVQQEGEVCFEPDSNGGTRVSVRLCYQPPAGAFGHAVATLFGADPKSDMDADLMRMKSMIETGRAPHDAAQPVGDRP